MSEKKRRVQKGDRDPDAERRRWVKNLKTWDISEAWFDRVTEDLRAEFGNLPAVRDVVWRIYQELTSRLRDSWSLQQQLQYEMAIFVNEEGKTPRISLEQAKRYFLLQVQMNITDLGMKGAVVIMGGSDSCAACKAHGGKEFSLEEALKTMPLPNRGCTRIMDKGTYPFCRCNYGVKSSG